MLCPRCGLPDEVPPTSRRCACGFELAAGGSREQPAIGLRGIGIVVLLALPITLVIASGVGDARPAIVHAIAGLLLVLAGHRRMQADRNSFPKARLHR